MAETREIVFDVPAELYSGCKGLALDIGNSLIKIVYRLKDDKEMAIRNGPNLLGRLRLVSFPRNQLTAALEYVRPRADVTRTAAAAERPTIYTTGLGCTEFHREICDTLNINIENVSEFDLNINLFVYLKRRLTRSELLEPLLSDDITSSIVAMSSGLPWSQLAKQSGTTRAFDHVTGKLFDEAVRRLQEKASRADDILGADALSLAEKEKDAFPCLLAMCGSTLVLYVVRDDGTYSLINSSPHGGRSFIGLGNLLVGCKSFDELVELASHGNGRNIDQYVNDRQRGNEGPDGENATLYEQLGDNSMLMNAFGNVVHVNRDELKREDVARSLLKYTTAEVSQYVIQVCQSNGLKRVFFCGGLCDHSFVRRVMTQEFVYTMLLQMWLSEIDYYVDFDFIKPGTYLGALGCALNDINKFI